MFGALPLSNHTPNYSFHQNEFLWKMQLFLGEHVLVY